MKLATSPKSLVLRLEDCLRLQDAWGVSVRSIGGMLWITQEGDPVDHVIEPGDSFVIERPGLTLVSAAGATEVHIETWCTHCTDQHARSLLLAMAARRLRTAMQMLVKPW